MLAVERIDNASPLFRAGNDKLLPLPIITASSSLANGRDRAVKDGLIN